MNDWIDITRKQREIAFEPKYGPIRPKTDKRCFRREMVEELLDSLNYCQWAFQKGEINRKQHQSLSADIRKAIKTLYLACGDKFEWETSWMK